MLCNYQRGPERLPSIMGGAPGMANAFRRSDKPNSTTLFPNRGDSKKKSLQQVDLVDILEDALAIVENENDEEVVHLLDEVNISKDQSTDTKNDDDCKQKDEEKEHHYQPNIRWQKAPLHPHEETRMEVLRATNVLDTDPEDRFDCLTSKAQQTFDVPIVLVSLVDEHRQWFKSVQGIDAKETPRDQAFCAHAILQKDKVFNVPDATQDDRFADNPLVQEGPKIRFYAGTPLRVGGINVGTLCLIDMKKRELRDDQLSALKEMGLKVEQELAKTFSSTRLTKKAKKILAMAA